MRNLVLVLGDQLDVRSAAFELKYIRLAARELDAALSLEPRGPRAEVARRVRTAIERLHGI